MTNEGNGSPDHEPQSPSRSISQKVSVADVLAHTVSRNSDNHHWMHLTRLREHSKVPDCTDYSRRNETAINLSF
jgi:hypothetical protein